jgi:hypothetical protein
MSSFCMWSAAGTLDCIANESTLIAKPHDDTYLLLDAMNTVEGFEGPSPSACQPPCKSDQVCLKETNTCAAVLPAGSTGCATPGGKFVCAAGTTCTNDRCVASDNVIEVVKNPKTYYGHDGDAWHAGLGQACTNAMACHRGMKCMPPAASESRDKNTCRAFVAPGSGADCRLPDYMCVPGYACSSTKGTCTSPPEGAVLPTIKTFEI